MLEPDLFSGWGIRTASTRERRFNPISYHNGTIWPHDNSLIGAGLARYGLMNDVAPILDGLIEVAIAAPPAQAIEDCAPGAPSVGSAAQVWRHELRSARRSVIPIWLEGA